MSDLIEKNQLSLKASVDLEWGKVLDCLAGQAVSIPGARLCRDLVLCSDIDEVALRLKETTEMADILTEGGGLPLSPFSDLKPILDSVQKGIILEARDFKEISGFLGIVSDVKKYIDRNEGVPALHDIVSDLEELRDVKREIDDAVDGDGNIKEDATARLKSLIRRTREFKMQIREKLKEIIHSNEYAEMLQEPFFTQRENRYVIPVKIEFKAKIEGIVHDLSASGATVFIEPRGLVEMNNRLKMLEVEVEDEVSKILKSLSDEVVYHQYTISHDQTIMAVLDCIYARARLSRMMDGRAVRLNNMGVINLKTARHPILSISGQEVVPNDILITEDTATLIISGPNSGGKTVLLKTIGLFALMVRGGLHLSCGDDSEMALFLDIYTDIGDDQDIGMGLSSFSAHIKTVASVFRYGGPGSLVLLDELAVSTDPLEGAAFAEAVLLEMKEREFKVVVTTHYNSLKALGHSEHGFCNASVDLDLKTLSPTYKVIYGIPGRSFAMEAAGRLGIDRGIIEEAMERLGRADLSLDHLLADLSEKKRNYEEDSKKARDLKLEAERLVKEQIELTSRLKEAERDIKKKMKAELNRELSKARQVIAGIVEEVKREKGIEEANRAKRLLLKMEIEISNNTAGSDDYIPLEDLRAGANVEISGLGIEGILLEDPSDRKTIRVKVGDSEIKVNPTLILGLKHGAWINRSRVERPIQRLSLTRTTEHPTRLDLRGKSGEESLAEIQKFLDSALLNGIKEVSLVHGHGSGRLKKAIREYLKESPYVLSYHPGGIYEGGDGTTVVELQ